MNKESRRRRETIKAIVVTPYYDPKIGGLEVFAHQLNVALKDLRGWDITIVTSNPNGRHTVVSQVDGMKLYRLGTWFRFSNTPLNPLWPLLMRRIFRREQPDVIVVHTPVPSVADAARLAAVGYVPEQKVFSGEPKRPRRVPFIVVYHAATLSKGDSSVFDLIARLYQWYERHGLLCRADLICAVSDYVKQQFPAGLQAKTVVFANAVWQRQITTRPQPTAPDFLFIGSLHRTHAWKGLRQIIQAIAELRARGVPATLTIMGDGNDRAGYERLVAELGLDGSVRLLGNTTGEPKETEFRRAMALVAYPTSANDAFPTVMLEAWARGVPVVASAIGPLPSLVDDGQDGYLAEPRNVTALTDKLQAVAELSPADRQAVAERALARVRANHTWERQADLLDGWAKELL